MARDIVEVYKGVEIERSCGYYYPTVNGNIECKTIESVKEWIDRIWVPYRNGLRELDFKMRFGFQNYHWN